MFLFLMTDVTFKLKNVTHSLAANSKSVFKLAEYIKLGNLLVTLLIFPYRSRASWIHIVIQNFDSRLKSSREDRALLPVWRRLQQI